MIQMHTDCGILRSVPKHRWNDEGAESARHFMRNEQDVGYIGEEMALPPNPDEFPAI